MTKEVWYSLSFLFFMIMISCQEKKYSGEEQQEREAYANSTINKLLYPRDNYIDPSVEINLYDTIIKGEYEIRFEPTDSVSFPLYYEDQQYRDSLTKEMHNSEDIALAVELNLHNKFKEHFSQTEGLLTLYLDNGNQITLRNLKDEGDGYKRYIFENYFEDLNYILLYVQLYEGGCYMLVNKNNGFKKEICGRPYFSPDKKSFLTANVDLEAGYSYNGIEYYLIQADTFVENFDIQIKNWGPENIQWTSDSTINILRIS